VSLESLSQKFEENIANQRGDHRDFKLAAVKTSVIAHDALFLTHARAFEFAHEEVGVKRKMNAISINALGRSSSLREF
jgi:hypothetical protein